MLSLPTIKTFTNHAMGMLFDFITWHDYALFVDYWDGFADDDHPIQFTLCHLEQATEALLNEYEGWGFCPDCVDWDDQDICPHCGKTAYPIHPQSKAAYDFFNGLLEDENEFILRTAYDLVMPEYKKTGDLFALFGDTDVLEDVVEIYLNLFDAKTLDDWVLGFHNLCTAYHNSGLLLDDYTSSIGLDDDELEDFLHTLDAIREHGLRDVLGEYATRKLWKWFKQTHYNTLFPESRLATIRGGDSWLE